MLQTIEHIGIAVKSLQRSIPVFEKILNTSCYKQEIVESEKVKTAFFNAHGNKIELLEATEQDSVIEKFIEKKGEGLHHIAFKVSDIRQEMSRLAKEGFTLLQKEPKLGADNQWVCFIHPKDTHGVLIELCQERSL